MTRFKHDEFAKDLFRTILELFGEVEIERLVRGESRWIDVFFTPSKVVPKDPTLALLWKCAAQGAAFEPFRSPVRDWEVRSTMGKLFDVHGEIARKAHSDKTPQLQTRELPRLWIITPTMSKKKLKLANVVTEEGWCSGIYSMGEMVRTGIIVVHKLPKIPETVWFRMLGVGKVQQEAVQEIAALSEGTTYREKILELFASLKVNLEASTDQDPNEMELLMSLTKSPAFVEFMEKTRNEGRNQGRNEGRNEERKSIVESLLVSRFNSLDEELSMIISNVLLLSPSEFTPLLLQLSREELIDRFRST